MNEDRENEIKEMIADKDKKNKYVELFKRTFELKNINLDITKLPLLRYILEEFSDYFDVPTEEEKILDNKATDYLLELDRLNTPRQRDLFEEYNNYESDKNYLREERIVMFGYCIANVLNSEMQTLKGKDSYGK